MPHALSAQDLALSLRQGLVTSEALVSEHIARCKAVNPHINAIVHNRYSHALEEARQADALLSKALEAGHDMNTFAAEMPLLGVPCSLKESIQMAGMPNTGGLVNRMHVVIEQDAPTVRNLREAGAVILGVTNTSEACMWMESFNKVYGLSSNPYDLSRTVGGSSGGEGAIIGSGAVPFGMGSDVGGSIRMPAFFNGIFGHKASPHLISNQGQFPQSTGDIDLYLSTGPMCQRASDLEFLTRIMAGSEASRLQDVSSADLSKLRVLTFKKERAVTPDADQSLAVKRSTSALVRRGMRHEVIDLPLMSKAFDLWSAALASAGSEKTFADHLFGSRNPAVPAKELLRMALGQSQNTLPLVLLSLLERMPDVLPARQRHLLAQAKSLHGQFRDVLGDDGVLLTVPYPTVAPKHYAPMFPPFRFVNCAIFNAMSLPATSIPTGLNKQGLPTGIQAVANEGFDHFGMAVAMALEEDLGGWVPPPIRH